MAYKYKRIKGVYIKVKPKQVQCLQCGKETLGNAAKKYCDHICRSRYWNRELKMSKMTADRIRAFIKRNKEVILAARDHKITWEKIIEITDAQFSADSMRRYCYELFPGIVEKRQIDESDDAAIVAMIDDEGLSWKEVSELTGKSDSTLKDRYRREKYGKSTFDEGDLTLLSQVDESTRKKVMGAWK